jgi:Mn-dependent DtxR family transcriptional regulator
MSIDPFDVTVLRAMLRLARRCQDADDGEIAIRVCRPPHAVRAAVRRLDGLGLVEHRARSAPRLTMAGLALAVALLPGAGRTATRTRHTPRAA